MSDLVITFNTFAALQDAITNNGNLLPSSGGKFKFHTVHRNGTHAKTIYVMFSIGSGSHRIIKYEADNDEIPLTDDWIDTVQSGYYTPSTEISDLEINET